jgi:hypothetical protein
MDVFSWLKWVQLSEFLNFGNKGKSQGARSDEYGVFSSIGIFFRLNTGKFFGTILAHIFFMLKFVVTICLTIYVSIFNSFAIILMPK